MDSYIAECGGVFYKFASGRFCFEGILDDIDLRTSKEWIKKTEKEWEDIANIDDCNAIRQLIKLYTNNELDLKSWMSK